jgi:hypothetical protein
MKPEHEALVKRLGESEKAFRDHPVYTMDGDPVRLIVQADEIGEAQQAITDLSADLAALTSENANLRLQAESWAMEAKTHESSLHEAYQAVTGATGEPGNWNGARPIIEALAAKDAEIERLREALKPFAKTDLTKTLPDDWPISRTFQACYFRRAHAALNHAAEGK